MRSSGISHTKNNLSTIFFYYLFLILSPLIPYKIIINSKRAISSHNYFEKNKFILIHNGFKKKIHARFIKNRVSNTFRIGHYARFDPQKNHKLILDCASVLKKKKINFCIYMHGRHINKKNKFLLDEVMKNKLNNHVKLLDEISNVDSSMRKMDCIISASSFGEGFRMF